MTNLFSIFDPATPNFLSLNWASTALFLPFLVVSFWVMPNRYQVALSSLNFYILGEFRPIAWKSVYVLSLIVSVFIFIVFNNSLGLLPYIFTSTSHLAFTLSFALVVWVALMMYGWLNNYSNLLVHLIPQGTPALLMPFMVLIETVSNMIRPGTLAVRLSANMIAGHLLIVLLSSATPFTPYWGLPVLMGAQVALSGLEVAVAFIQGYVFSALVTLYVSEFTD
uniref:ATP synthase subunit a n=1 Tax=Haustorioides koreanus TaxID=2729224 RepID=A0A6M3RJ61_9CRUS|nr:ATP synthase F0 subunit 6 [Haustorioides koreanus]